MKLVLDVELKDLKKCTGCPLLEHLTFTTWCRYLEERVVDSTRKKECPLREEQ